ncbi:hypothetical protein GCM10012280_36390 [Wenjunlia tyrosinilytica]|uniref:Uncharacterized protein n=2 Tax=Wenjunlia tyrosinilytica TaxID=1544741 RepID=A0A917ZRW5_9ACTN|nr:hypothetical protein GCM10012280_36390 [Wenjunlia tyrosinilytica]
MRVTIAGHSFYLEPSEVERAMSGIKPEPISGESVRIGRRSFPIKQVGAVITRQDRRDFSAAEVSRALRKMGFACKPAPAPEPPTLSEPAPMPTTLLDDAGMDAPEPTDMTSPMIAPPAAPQPAMGFLSSMDGFPRV